MIRNLLIGVHIALDLGIDVPTGGLALFRSHRHAKEITRGRLP